MTIALPGQVPGPAGTQPIDPVDFQAGPPGGEATAYLRAAAYLSRPFRAQAIEELVEHRYRVAAPAPGTDTPLVLAECLRARRELVLAGLAMLLVAAVGLLASTVTALLALTVVFAARIAGGLARTLVAFWVLRTGGSSTDPVLVTVRRVLSFVFYVILTSVIGGVAASQASSWLDGYNNPVLGMSGGYSGDGGYGGYGYRATSSGDVFVWQGFLAMLLCWVVIGAVVRIRIHSRLAALGEPGGARIPVGAPPSLADVFTRLRENQGDAETVFGAFRPFAGAGLPEPVWSLQLPLLPATPGEDAEPLDVPGLHTRIAASVAHLAAGEAYPGDPMHRLTVRDRLFRSGLRAERPDSWNGQLSEQELTTGRRRLNGDWAATLDRAAHPRIRHYLEFRAELWEMQVVATMYLRVQVQGQMLRIEGLPYVLPPVAEYYREIDELLRPNPLDFAVHAWRALTNLGRDFTGYASEPFGVLRSLFRGWKNQLDYQAMLQAGRPVQHAPRTSVRELGAAPSYEHVLQSLDVERLFDAMAQRALTALVAELKLAGYETDQLERAGRNVNLEHGVRAAARSGGRAALPPTARMGTR